MDDPAGVRSLIGFLTSELKLEDVFSPDYLFDFFSELHHVDAPVRDERKRQLFARFGIDRFAQTKVADLSTGMKQKASLAISLVHDPRVIHLRRADERPGRAHGQDGDRTSCWNWRADGRTVLLSTHIFSLVGEGVRPRGRRHRRAHGGLGNAVGGGGGALVGRRVLRPVRGEREGGIVKATRGHRARHRPRCAYSRARRGDRPCGS